MSETRPRWVVAGCSASASRPASSRARPRLVLIVAFSVGLALAITSIGLVAITAKRAFSRMSFEGRLIRALPAVSAVIVLALGVTMTVRALNPLL